MTLIISALIPELRRHVLAQILNRPSVSRGRIQESKSSRAALTEMQKASALGAAQRKPETNKPVSAAGGPPRRAQDLQHTVRQLQGYFIRDGVHEREIAETFKSISKQLDTAVELTRKRPTARENDKEWIERKEKLARSRQDMSDLFKVRRKSTT